jgi:predicted nucleotidyltransferase
MSTSNPIIELLRSHQWDKIISDVSKVATALDIDFFIIGAAARDIWLHEQNHRMRVTKDIDFAVSITETSKFYALKKGLCERFDYKEDGEYSLIGANGEALDLVPYGEMRVNYSDVMAISPNEEGLKEVAELGLMPLDLDNGFSIKIATLAAIALLKLISWDDQKELRTKDAEDIDSIIKSYFDLHINEIFEVHYDVIPDDPEQKDFNARIGASVLGRHIGKIVADKPTLKNQIIRILSNEIQVENTKGLAAKMIGKTEDTIFDKKVLLNLLLEGVEKV